MLGGIPKTLQGLSSLLPVRKEQDICVSWHGRQSHRVFICQLYSVSSGDTCVLPAQGEVLAMARQNSRSVMKSRNPAALTIRSCQLRPGVLTLNRAASPPTPAKVGVAAGASGTCLRETQCLSQEWSYNVHVNRQMP